MQRFGHIQLFHIVPAPFLLHLSTFLTPSPLSTHIHACMHARTHTCTHTHMHAHTHTLTHTHTYTNAHMHAYARTHIHTPTHTRTHTQRTWTCQSSPATDEKTSSGERHWTHKPCTCTCTHDTSESLSLTSLCLLSSCQAANVPLCPLSQFNEPLETQVHGLPAYGSWLLCTHIRYY